MNKKINFIFSLVDTTWVVYTLYTIARYGGAVVLDPETTGRIMAVNNDGRIITAWGLTYHGATGALLVIVQFVIVTLALLAAHYSSAAGRIVGLIVLVAWAGLWLGNALWLGTVGWIHPTDTAALGVAALATIGWLLTSARETASHA
jgi:hypothetical protein